MDQFIVEKFREKINNYYPISDASFEALLNIATISRLSKNEIFIEQGVVCRQFCFLYSGYMTAYINDSEGRTYNKNLFIPSDWVSSLVSAILQQPSEFTAKAITDCIILCLPYHKWRELIFKIDDLKSFYLHYLEKNWVIDKEKREVSLVMDDAQTRYEKLLLSQPEIENYVPLQDIASHLGITPTQLSRIRKLLK